MKIVVVGLGYVGLSNAVLLAQHNEVIGVDISQQRVDSLNLRKSPIIDAELSEYLEKKHLNISATTDLIASVKGADYIIVSTPTNYDERTNSFDTSSVEDVISQVKYAEPKACIVVKSTIPIGFIDKIRARLKHNKIFFSPEFLREGKALHDNLFPTRIIVGEKSKQAEIYANLLTKGALKANVKLLFTGSREAEAIKLFSNTYLAMRVAFYNELDSFALASELDSRDIINGVSLDTRIGDYYNNPSFGYGGYCLPKDTKQLLATYNNIPQNLIKAVIDSNATRKIFLADTICKRKPQSVGVYRLAMKSSSDNFRHSSILDIIQILKHRQIKVVIYEPKIVEPFYNGVKVENNLEKFKNEADLIIANRLSDRLIDVKHKVFSRDLSNRD